MNYWIYNVYWLLHATLMPVSPHLSGDLSSRRFKPEIRVSSLRFSPTGRVFVFTAQHTDRYFSIFNNSDSAFNSVYSDFLIFSFNTEQNDDVLNYFFMQGAVGRQLLLKGC